MSMTEKETQTTDDPKNKDKKNRSKSKRKKNDSKENSVAEIFDMIPKDMLEKFLRIPDQLENLGKRISNVENVANGTRKDLDQINDLVNQGKAMAQQMGLGGFIPDQQNIPPQQLPSGGQPQSNPNGQPQVLNQQQTQQAVQGAFPVGPNMGFNMGALTQLIPLLRMFGIGQQERSEIDTMIANQSRRSVLEGLIFDRVLRRTFVRGMGKTYVNAFSKALKDANLDDLSSEE